VDDVFRRRALFHRTAIPPPTASPAIAIVLGSGTACSVYVVGTWVVGSTSWKDASATVSPLREIVYVPGTTSTPDVSSVNVAIVVGVAVMVTGVKLNDV
jgi:hypothetical protein